MAFQPFGYRFEIHSFLTPSDVKAEIRSRKSSIFDAKNGARGWVAGPFICLWFSAFDKHGPMLFGLISQDNLGTRVHGRAGSDLNGVAMFTLLIPLVALLIIHTISEGSGSARQLGVFAVLFLIGGPLFYWWAHTERREAEPLVRFLRNAITTSGRSLREKSSRLTISKVFTLNDGGEDHHGSVTPESIHDALLGVGAGNFVILQSEPETYIQTASRDGGFIIEMRQGDHRHHFQAVRRNADPSLTDNSNDIFTFEEALAVFMAYGSETSLPRFVTWEPMHFPN